MTEKNRSILKAAALDAYQNVPEVVEAIEKMDFTEVDKLYDKELLNFVSEQEIEEVERFLESEVFARYMQGADQSAFKCAEVVMKEVAGIMLKDVEVSKVLH